MFNMELPGRTKRTKPQRTCIKDVVKNDMQRVGATGEDAAERRLQKVNFALIVDLNTRLYGNKNVS